MTVRVVLCPPLFFAQRREWPAFVLNGVPYVVCLLLIGAGLYQLVICAVDSAVDAAVGAVVALWAWGLISWLLCFVHVADTRRRERAAAREHERVRPSTKRRLVKVGLFLVSYVAIFVLAQSCMSRSMARPVGPEVPALFPVVVVTPGTGGETYQAHLVFHRDLKEFAQKNPGHSYLVPRGDEKRLRSRLDGGTFHVEHRADGKQAFEVEKTVHDEAYVVGWYEASEKEFFPGRFLLYHGMAFFVVAFYPVALGSLLLTWILGKLLESTLWRIK